MTATDRRHTAEDRFHDFVLGIGGYSVCRLGCGVSKALPPAPAVIGSRTSEAAARSQTDAGRTNKKAVIEAAIRASIDGLTAEKIETITGLPGNTVRPRIVELENERRIRKSGKRRLTRSGREAECYVVV